MKYSNLREIYRLEGFPIFLTYEDSDHLYLNFGGDFVVVRAPFNYPEEELLNFLDNKKETIRREIKNIKRWKRTSTFPRDFNGEDLRSARIFSKEYPIVLANVESANLVNGQLLIPEIVKNYPARFTEEFLDLF